MSMIRTGTIPLSKKNSNKPLSQGGYQSRTKLDRLIEVRYLMPWGCERMCAGQATVGECQTEQKTSDLSCSKESAQVENGYPKKYTNLRGVPPKVSYELDR